MAMNDPTTRLVLALSQNRHAKAGTRSPLTESKDPAPYNKVTAGQMKGSKQQVKENTDISQKITPGATLTFVEPVNLDGGQTLEGVATVLKVNDNSALLECNGSQVEVALSSITPLVESQEITIGDQSATPPLSQNQQTQVQEKSDEEKAQIIQNVKEGTTTLQDALSQGLTQQEIVDGLQSQTATSQQQDWRTQMKQSLTQNNQDSDPVEPTTAPTQQMTESFFDEVAFESLIKGTRMMLTESQDPTSTDYRVSKAVRRDKDLRVTLVKSIRGQILTESVDIKNACDLPDGDYVSIVETESDNIPQGVLKFTVQDSHIYPTAFTPDQESTAAQQTQLQQNALNGLQAQNVPPIPTNLLVQQQTQNVAPIPAPQQQIVQQSPQSQQTQTQIPDLSQVDEDTRSQILSQCSEDDLLKALRDKRLQQMTQSNPAPQQ